MKGTKAYPNNPHMNYYTSEGWIYLGTLETDVNDWGIIDMYVNHAKKWTSYVYGNWGGDYMSCDYDNLFNGNPFQFNTSPFKDIHTEFVRRSRVQQLLN